MTKDRPNMTSEVAHFLGWSRIKSERTATQNATIRAIIQKARRWFKKPMLDETKKYRWSFEKNS